MAELPLMTRREIWQTRCHDDRFEIDYLKQFIKDLTTRRFTYHRLNEYLEECFSNIKHDKRKLKQDPFYESLMFQVTERIGKLGEVVKNNSKKKALIKKDVGELIEQIVYLCRKQLKNIDTEFVPGLSLVSSVEYVSKFKSMLTRYYKTREDCLDLVSMEILLSEFNIQVYLLATDDRVRDHLYKTLFNIVHHTLLSLNTIYVNLRTLSVKGCFTKDDSVVTRDFERLESWTKDLMNLIEIATFKYY